jgi:hypothetical protein
MQLDGFFVKVLPRPSSGQVAPLVAAVRAKLNLQAVENGLPTIFVSSGGRTFVCIGCSVAASSGAFLALRGTSITVSGTSFNVREWAEQRPSRDPTVVLLSTMGCALDDLAVAIYNSERVWTAGADYVKPTLEVLRGYLKRPAGKEHVVVACPGALRTMLLTAGSFVCDYTVVRVVDPIVRQQRQEGANIRAPAVHGDQRFHEVFQRLKLLEDAVEEHSTAISTIREDTSTQLRSLQEGMQTLLQRGEPAAAVRSPVRTLFGSSGSADLGPELSRGSRPATKTAGGVSPARFGSLPASGGAKRIVPVGFAHLYRVTAVQDGAFVCKLRGKVSLWTVQGETTLLVTDDGQSGTKELLQGLDLTCRDAHQKPLYDVYPSSCWAFDAVVDVDGRTIVADGIGHVRTAKSDDATFIMVSENDITNTDLRRLLSFMGDD